MPHGIKSDLVGKRFGGLVVIEELEERRHACIVWLCRCDCGNIISLRTDRLTTKNRPTISCGCAWEPHPSGEDNPCYKHGLSGTPEYLVISAHRHREKYPERTNRLKVAEVRQRMAELGGVCVYCGGPFEEIDHVIPISRGGLNVLENLVPSCKHCNRTKNDKLLDIEWQPKLPRAERY